MSWDDYDPDEDVRAELRQEDAQRRRHTQQLLAHPDPRDPDHPGEEGEDL